MNILDTGFCADSIVPCDAPFDYGATRIFFNYLITPLCANAGASAQALGEGTYNLSASSANKTIGK